MCCVDEVVVDGASPAVDEQVVDGLEEREVAVDPDREVLVGERGAPAEQPARTVCGFLNRMQPGFGQRVDGDDLAPARLAASSVVSIRGWLVPGFWPDHDDQVGRGEVGDV